MFMESPSLCDQRTPPLCNQRLSNFNRAALYATSPQLRQDLKAYLGCVAGHKISVKVMHLVA